jgi:hypothetical protein
MDEQRQKRKYTRLLPYNAKKEKVKIPKRSCSSCTKFTSNYCTFYKRYVEKYNKCFYHSFYSSFQNFRPPENLEEIVEREEKLNELN